MFSTATRNFVEEIDDDGSLIPVSSLIDSDKLVPLSLVVKRKRFWIWQKPKYLPSDFTLSDVLTGDTPLTPVVVKTDFLKYQGTFGDNKSGNFESNLVAVNLKVEGKDTSKLQSSFGSLKKEEVDVQKLLRDSKDKLLDMSHCLIQQTREKSREVFAVVKERIVTTQPCSVIEEVQQGGQLGELLSFCGPKSTQASVKENSSLHKDSNVSLEIPAHTVIAYGIIELEIKLNGHYGEGVFIFLFLRQQHTHDIAVSDHIPVLLVLQVQHVAAGSGETLSLSDAGLAVLTEEELYQRTESLFGHSEVTLKREEDTLRTEMKDQPGYLPIVMSITVKGLASLV
uniref:Gasdermin Eb n=1 Tax=Oncorhynchus mykiss TaxID=8022 RepID=A0A8C7NEP2_ONCMY